MIRASQWSIRLLALGVLGVSCQGSPGSAPPAKAPDPRPEETVRLLRAASLDSIRVSFDDRWPAVRTLRGRYPTLGGDRAAAAHDFLRRHAARFGLDAALTGLEVTREVETPGGVSVVFSQRHRGLEVFAGQVLVAFDSQGDIIHVRNDVGLGLDLEVTAPGIPAAEARRVAGEYLGLWLPTGGVASRRVVVRGGKGHPGYHVAWRVEARLPPPQPGEWLVFVSVETGVVVRALDRLRHGGAPCVPCSPANDPACGLVLHENPVDALNDPGLTDGSNVDGVQTGCVLTNLTSATNLDGLWANTALSMPRVATPYDTLRSAGQTALDEVNAYYHVNRAKEYLESLGHPGPMSYSITIDAHDSSLGDNSHYSPMDKELHFGEGGVDDAQDADVVYHEYGHALQDDQVPGYGQSSEGGATGEGFGDYWAAAITDGSACLPALGAACVASWDAASYNPYNGSPGSGCLRWLDSAKQYPQDFEWEVHADGEIWSAALWSLRGQLGATTADGLVIQAHSYLTPGADFIDAADALLSADVALHGGVHAGAIHAVMAGRGLPRTGTPASTANMNQWTPFSCATAHDYASGEYVQCSHTVPGADRVRLRFTTFNTEDGWDYVYISDPDYLQVERLSGNLGGDVLSAAVEGDTIVARFKADGSVQRYGFDIDRVYYASSSCTTSAECDDSNPCTDDVCDLVTGCANPSNSLACDDGDPCTAGDQCVGGACVGGAPVACDDGNPCNGVETCVGGLGCQSGPPPSCSDGNPCTDDVCDAAHGGCRHPFNSVGCSDGDPCTGPDQCVLGQCTAGPWMQCDDGNPCNGLETCVPGGGCQSGPPPVCDDGNVCNGSERCVPGLGCQTGPWLDCNDGDACTFDTCHPITGCIHHQICVDAGVPPPDGHMPPPDGHMPPPDGHMPPPDGHTPPPDGATPLPDGGSPLPVSPPDTLSPRPGCSCGASSGPGGAGSFPAPGLLLAFGLLLALRRRRRL